MGRAGGGRAGGGAGRLPGAGERAAGEQAVRPLVVEMHPRLKDVTLDDLKAQFDLARAGAGRDQPGQRRRRPDSRPQGADRRPRAEGPEPGDRPGRRRDDARVERGRGRAVPGPEPVEPGPAQLPDQVEQQARGPAPQHRDRRRAADRWRARRVRRSCRPNSTPCCSGSRAIEENHLAAFNRLLSNGGLEPVAVKPAAAAEGAGRDARRYAAVARLGRSAACARMSLACGDVGVRTTRRTPRATGPSCESSSQTAA